jgi:hypothetical protein
MKRPDQSRGVCAQKTEPSSIGTSIASIKTVGVPPAEPSSIEISIGSIGTEETAPIPDGDKEVGAPISSIDPADTTYFIQYHPELAEKFSKEKNSSISVSSRTLSIVFSRMLYWSKFSKWKFCDKLWFWKSQDELSTETLISTKQINRALKVLVEMGLLIREKFHKQYYRQVYFYHIPVSPFTKKEVSQGTRTSRSTRGTSRTISNGSAGYQRQQFHHRSPVALEVPTPPVMSSSPSASATVADGPARASGASAGSGDGSPKRKRSAFSGLGAPAATRPTNPPKGSAPIRTICSDIPLEFQDLKNISLKSIVERCNFIGKYGIERVEKINRGG